MTPCPTPNCRLDIIYTRRNNNGLCFGKTIGGAGAGRSLFGAMWTSTRGCFCHKKHSFIRHTGFFLFQLETTSNLLHANAILCRKALRLQLGNDLEDREFASSNQGAKGRVTPSHSFPRVALSPWLKVTPPLRLAQSHAVARVAEGRVIPSHTARRTVAHVAEGQINASHPTDTLLSPALLKVKPPSRTAKRPVVADVCARSGHHPLVFQKSTSSPTLRKVRSPPRIPLSHVFVYFAKGRGGSSRCTNNVGVTAACPTKNEA